MKKLLLVIFVLCLCGCGMNAQHTTSLSQKKSKANLACAEFKKIKVFQTLSDGGLARVCEQNSSDKCYGMIVFVSERWDMQLWDEKIITPPEDKCFVYTDTVSYTTQGKSKKTVPILGFDYEYWPRTPEESNARTLANFEDIWFDCRYNVKRTVENSKKSDEEKQRLQKEGLNWCNCIYENAKDTWNNRGETLEENLQINGNLDEGFEMCNKKYPWLKEKI